MLSGCTVHVCRTEEASNFDFCPVTFELPGDYALFVEEFKRFPGSVWIMKPIGSSQGKGIFLINKLSQISQWKSEYRWKPDTPGVEAYVVQQYIPNPYLVSVPMRLPFSMLAGEQARGWDDQEVGALQHHSRLG